MRRFLLVIMALVLLGETAAGQADVVMVGQLQALVNLATAQQSLDWNNANNIYMNMYYLSQMATDSYRQIQNQVESLKYQMQSLKGRAPTFNDAIGAADSILMSYEDLRSKFNTAQYMITGSEGVSLPDVIPARARLQQIQQAKQQLENLKPYPGETPDSYKRRIDAALSNLRAQWSQNERAEQKMAQDVLSITATIQKKVAKYDAQITSDKEAASPNSTENNSTVAQLQILNSQLATLSTLTRDLVALTSAQAAHSLAASERVEKQRAVADAMESQSMTISAPDTTNIEQQIKSSGVSVNDLTGVSTSDGSFDFNKKW